MHTAHSRLVVMQVQCSVPVGSLAKGTCLQDVSMPYTHTFMFEPTCAVPN